MYAKYPICDVLRVSCLDYKIKTSYCQRYLTSVGLLSLALVCVPNRDAFSDDNIRSGGIVPVLQTFTYGYSYRILVYDGSFVDANDYVPILNCQYDFEGEGSLYQ
jgi:hypothetical protein